MKMKKTIIVLSLAASLFAGSAIAQSPPGLIYIAKTKEGAARTLVQQAQVYEIFAFGFPTQAAAESFQKISGLKNSKITNPKPNDFKLIFGSAMMENK